MFKEMRRKDRRIEKQKGEGLDWDKENEAEI